MKLLELVSGILRPAVPFLAVLALVFAGLFLVRYALERRLGKVPDARLRIQLVMLALSLAGLLAVITVLPVSETLRGQLLSLVGILLSASIALSATTFLGNAMAGVLLRVIGSFKIGDFVRVREHFGRVSERGLFHTEIQTEDRDLTTLPNLLLVSNPLKVVRSSGTIVSAQVSLGYDTPRDHIKQLLLEATNNAGLQESFVHIVDLGDFSVTYRAAGLLGDVKKLLSAGSNLRGAIMDELHAAGIEIVSPNFMNTRALREDARFVPARVEAVASLGVQVAEGPEAVIFDKAEEAEAVDELRRKQQNLEKEIKIDEQQLQQATTDTGRDEIERRVSAAKAEHETLTRTLERAQEEETAED